MLDLESIDFKQELAEDGHYIKLTATAIVQTVQRIDPRVLTYDGARQLDEIRGRMIQDILHELYGDVRPLVQELYRLAIENAPRYSSMRAQILANRISAFLACDIERAQDY